MPHSVLFLSGLNSLQRFVADALITGTPIIKLGAQFGAQFGAQLDSQSGDRFGVQVVQLTYDGAAKSSPLSKTAKIQRAIHWRWRKTWQGVIDKAIERQLPGKNISVSLAVPRSDFAQILSIIESVQPDLIVCFGAPFFPRSFLDSVKFPIWNIHLGNSAKYRGEHCLFWPLRFGDTEGLGWMIHEMTPVLDGGAVIARGTLPVETAFSESTAQVAAVRQIAEILPQKVSQFFEHSLALSKNEIGGSKNYRMADRKIFDDLVYAVRSLGYRWQNKRGTFRR